MRFSCTQENLQQGLTAVSHIASKNVNLPILNNILINIQDGAIKFSTTNLRNRGVLFGARKNRS